MANEKHEREERKKSEAEDSAEFVDSWLKRRSEAWADVINSVDKWLPPDDPSREKIIEVAKKLHSFQGDPSKWFNSEEERLTLARFMMIFTRAFVERTWPSLQGTPEAKQLEYWFFRAFTMGYKYAHL